MIPMRDARLSHLVVVVSDLSEAREFYERNFGFELIEEVEDADGWTAMLAGPAHELHLHRCKRPNTPVGLNRAAYVLEESAFDRLVADLERRGVARSGLQRSGDRRWIRFRDFDGVEWECATAPARTRRS